MKPSRLNPKAAEDGIAQLQYESNMVRGAIKGMKKLHKCISGHKMKMCEIRIN